MLSRDRLRILIGENGWRTERLRLERHWLKRRFKGCTSGEQKSSLKPASCAPLASSNSSFPHPSGMGRKKYTEHSSMFSITC